MLDKPFVLLKKSTEKIDLNAGNDDDDEDQLMIDDDEDGESAKKKTMKKRDEEFIMKTDYLVQAVIRKKLLFNKRPRPIVCYQPKQHHHITQQQY